MSLNQEKVLEVKDLKISFYTDNGILKAVRGVSFDLTKGETLCIVGESGSGKSVTSKAIMGILANNSIIEGGSILYEGENLLEISEEEFHRIRGKKIGMIFQDPLSSLNPIVRIGKQITEATLINGNKLKKMHDEIISVELVAYKNAQAQGKIAIKKAKDQCLLKTKEAYSSIPSVNNEQLKQKYSNLVQKELDDFKNAEENIRLEIAKTKRQFQAKIREASKNTKATKQEIDALINGYKVECEKTLNQIKVNGNSLLADLKAKLQAKSNAAKQEVQAYKNQVLAEQTQKKIEAKTLAKQYKVEAEQEVIRIKQELKAILPPLKEALKAKEKVAKDEVNAYKAKIQQEHKENMANLKVKLAEATNKEEVQAEINAEKERFENACKITKKEAKKIAIEIMREVGIPDPERRFKQYPFEFSGGMRQRIVIAIALIAAPDILICDEPTTALDVTIQAQILELINRIKKERNLSCIFITHDLGVVANMADRVAVMYAGKIVEYGTSEEVFFDPRHPYTWALLSSIPDVDSKERLDAIPGTPPNMIYPPKGDAFALRSKYAMEIDFKYEPPFFKVSDTHYAATWLLDPRAPKAEMPKIVSERIKNALKEDNLDE